MFGLTVALQLLNQTLVVVTGCRLLLLLWLLLLVVVVVVLVVVMYWNNFALPSCFPTLIFYFHCHYNSSSISNNNNNNNNNYNNNYYYYYYYYYYYTRRDLSDTITRNATGALHRKWRRESTFTTGAILSAIILKGRLRESSFLFVAWTQCKMNMFSAGCWRPNKLESHRPSTVAGVMRAALMRTQTSCLLHQRQQQQQQQCRRSLLLRTSLARCIDRWLAARPLYLAENTRSLTGADDEWTSNHVTATSSSSLRSTIHHVEVYLSQPPRLAWVRFIDSSSQRHSTTASSLVVGDHRRAATLFVDRLTDRKSCSDHVTRSTWWGSVRRRRCWARRPPSARWRRSSVCASLCQLTTGCTR